MQLRAPAKVNLSFRILRRREDGFHEIETLMTPVSLHDVLTLEISGAAGGLQFSCDDPTLPTNDDNLVVRATRLFLDEVQMSPGLSIRLEKRIPHGAGLGGGSSDAASVLLGLNELLQANLPNDRLAAMAARIGSDVPFFVFRSAAECSGRGEIVRPKTLAHTFRLLLLKPALGVPTAWAYSRWQDSQPLPGIADDAQNFAGVTFMNDLERPVFEKYVFLARLKMWLREQAEVGATILSGSGATVLAALREGADAAALAARARAELAPELWACACETV
ncbi:MAG: 4-(cytidine 5'-diphospho)-2-C-methyl-D-erythritol kinase [Verrucomicrobiota bacterium]|nr:4-(cytidine 5'-diphospho)-2-C-methyl-D-erythritol kinase [Verrucomicrobiota bacterium]